MLISIHSFHRRLLFPRQFSLSVKRRLGLLNLPAWTNTDWYAHHHCNYASSHKPTTPIPTYITVFFLYECSLSGDSRHILHACNTMQRAIVQVTKFGQCQLCSALPSPAPPRPSHATQLALVRDHLSGFLDFMHSSASPKNSSTLLLHKLVQDNLFRVLPEHNMHKRGDFAVLDQELKKLYE